MKLEVKMGTGSWKADGGHALSSAQSYIHEEPMALDILIALSCDMSGISRLPYMLSRHGIRTTVLTAPDFLLSRSRSVHAGIPAPAGAESTACALEEHLKDGNHNYHMVILGDDPLNQFMAEHSVGSELVKHLPCSGDFKLNWSKAAFVETCRQHGLPIPETVIGTTLSEAKDAVLKIGFPLIFKETAGCSGKWVFSFESFGQLQDYMKARPTNEPWLIQKPLNGQRVTVDVLFDHGRPVVWASSIVEHTCNGPFSSSSTRRFVPMPELDSTVTAVGRMSGAHGFCGIDFIREADGRRKIIEMNCRPTVGHSLSLVAGIDFGKALAATLRGQESPPQHQLETPAIPMFPEDVGRCIGERDIAGLLSWIVLPSRWRLLPWHEPNIFAKNLIDLAARVISGIRKHTLKPMGYFK